MHTITAPVIVLCYRSLLSLILLYFCYNSYSVPCIICTQSAQECGTSGNWRDKHGAILVVKSLDEINSTRKVQGGLASDRRARKENRDDDVMYWTMVSGALYKHGILGVTRAPV